jgi:hypothetical protein
MPELQQVVLRLLSANANGIAISAVTSVIGYCRAGCFVVYPLGM